TPAGGQGDTFDDGAERLGRKSGGGRTGQDASQQHDLAAHSGHLGRAGGIRDRVDESANFQGGTVPERVSGCGDRQVQRAWQYEQGQPPLGQLLAEFAEKYSHYESLSRISAVSAGANWQRGTSSSTSRPDRPMHSCKGHRYTTSKSATPAGIALRPDPPYTPDGSPARRTAACKASRRAASETSSAGGLPTAASTARKAAASSSSSVASSSRCPHTYDSALAILKPTTSAWLVMQNPAPCSLLIHQAAILAPHVKVHARVRPTRSGRAGRRRGP